jgi:hypothetical protein
MSRDRDRILEQALKHELRATGTPPAGACLDAEALGAWTDGALDPTAMAAAEAHVSNCARCQAMVGTMLKSASPLGTLGTSGTRGTLSLWRWWLAPMAAGVTAVTLWMVVPEQQQLAVAPPQDKAASQAPAAESIRPAAPAKDAAREQFAERDNQPAAAARVDQLKEKSRNEPKEEARARPAQERGALADAAAPAAAPAPPPPAATSSPAALAESVAVLQKSMTAAPIEIATPDPSLGWRIVGDRIERSEDGGKTWKLTRQNPGDGIAGGSAPSNSVCWFVGRAGRVLLTTDSGATFTDVSLAEPLDLASVSATDARTADIYSAAGRRFRSEDGGRTWRPF